MSSIYCASVSLEMPNGDEPERLKDWRHNGIADVDVDVAEDLYRLYKFALADKISGITLQRQDAKRVTLREFLDLPPEATGLQLWQGIFDVLIEFRLSRHPTYFMLHIDTGFDVIRFNESDEGSWSFKQTLVDMGVGVNEAAWTEFDKRWKD